MKELFERNVKKKGGKQSKQQMAEACFPNSRRCACPPSASCDVTMQPWPWQHRVRGQVLPWWQGKMPDCLPHAAPDEVSWNTHPVTRKVRTVFKFFCLWIKFGSDDVQIPHVTFTLYSPASRDDTHMHAHTGSCLFYVCVCVCVWWWTE